jgi:hypothetical protein
MATRALASQASPWKVRSGNLRDGGLLVCANLSIAHEDSKAELNDVTKWRPMGSIEEGGTWAFVKNAEAAT